MKKNTAFAFLAGALAAITPAGAQDISVETAPPVVVKTEPAAGSAHVDPATSEIRVTFSKPMQDGSWSWATWGQDTFPETTGKPHYLDDGRTCVLPVKLKPGKFYATWLNSEKFHNFTDTQLRPAVPYLLTFETAADAVGDAASQSRPARPAAEADELPAPDWQQRLNADQKAILAWTERQFRAFFDNRDFAGWTDEDRSNLAKRSIDALKGPRTREYYQAINTLGALDATNALPELRELAFDRRDKDNRDRWMAVRVLGIMGDKESVPELIHLVYHGNLNTRWWAQIALVQLTGQNFGEDWDAWGKWWNESGREPSFKPGIIRWWSGQAEDDKLAASLAESDKKFLERIK